MTDRILLEDGTAVLLESGSNELLEGGVSAAQTFPNVIVEWLPGVGPNTASGSWVSMVPYVVEFTITRGRQYEIDQFAAGELEVTLRSTTRLFDPEYAAGTYFGQLIPMAQIRVRADFNGVTYDVWRGYITDWGATTPDDAYMRTTVRARDAFMLLEQIQLPSSAWALEVQRDTPSAWFRLGETDTARMTDSAGGNYGIYDNVDQGAQGLVVNDADGAIEIGTFQDSKVWVQNPSLISGYPFTVEIIEQTTSEDLAHHKVMFSGLRSTDFNMGRLTLAVTDGTGLAYQGQVWAIIVQADAAAYREVRSAINVDDGAPHQIGYVCASSSSNLIYVDGVDQTVVIAAGTPTWFGTADYGTGYYVGNYADVQYGDFNFIGTLDECVIYSSALSAARMAAHSLAAKTGWAGDTVGTRFTRFCDALGWPASLRSFDTGISTFGPASWSAGATALSVMQAWADTELGAFFVNGAGEIVVRSRHYPLLTAAATTSQGTFGDGNGAATLKYAADNFSLPRDETLIRNPVMASREGGVSVTVKDQTLIDNKYGNRAWSAPNSEDLLDSAVRDRALWLLARYKELGTRLESMTINAHRDPTGLFPQVLGRELGDRITVNRTVLGQGSELASAQIVERIEHHVTPKTWTTTFAGSPVDPNVGNYLILDTSLLDSASALLAY